MIFLIIVKKLINYNIATSQRNNDLLTIACCNFQPLNETLDLVFISLSVRILRQPVLSLRRNLKP